MNNYLSLFFTENSVHNHQYHYWFQRLKYWIEIHSHKQTSSSSSLISNGIAMATTSNRFQTNHIARFFLPILIVFHMWNKIKWNIKVLKFYRTVIIEKKDSIGHFFLNTESRYTRFSFFVSFPNHLTPSMIHFVRFFFSPINYNHLTDFSSESKSNKKKIYFNLKEQQKKLELNFKALIRLIHQWITHLMMMMMMAVCVDEIDSLHFF